MTVAEFQAATHRDDDQGQSYHVVAVHHHKTATSSGPARLVMTSQDYRRMRKYLHRIRPHLDREDVLDNFLTSGPKPIANQPALLKLLKNYNIDLPTATKLRKIGATTAARTLSHSKMALVAKQMGHSLSTSWRYYQAMASNRDALKAFAA